MMSLGLLRIEFLLLMIVPVLSAFLVAELDPWAQALGNSPTEGARIRGSGDEGGLGSHAYKLTSNRARTSVFYASRCPHPRDG